MDGQRDNIFRKGIGMIITKNGEIVECFWRENGIVVKDGEFSICLEYDETQKEQYTRMRELKQKLSETDYKALKFADGALTEVEYAPIKTARQSWRDEINEIEKTFKEPTITREELDAAEATAMQRLKEREARRGDWTDTIFN